MNAEKFSERLWDFAARVARVVDALPETRVGRHVAGQLVRCGTSSAPNYDEACSGESKADFAHKVGVATKEIRETRGWLRFIVRLEMQPSTRMNPLIDESEELLKMLVSSFRTAKGFPKPALPTAESQIPSTQSPVINPPHPLHPLRSTPEMPSTTG